MYPSTLLADPAFRPLPARAARFGEEKRVRVRAVRPRRTIRLKWVLLAALLALVAGGVGYLRTWPPLATVMSASMAPTINTGDIVVLGKLGRPARVGDVVSIAVPDQTRVRFGYPPVVIHRIVRIDADGTVTTKGDAYKRPDPFTIPRRALSTKVVATVPAAGRLMAYIRSPLGLIWLVGGAVALLGMPLLDRHREGLRREFGERESLQTTLQGVTEELALLREAQPESAVVAELRLLAAETAAREAATAAELRSMLLALTERDAIAAEERRAEQAAAAAREEQLRAANAAAAETLQAVTASLTESVEAANRRAEAAETQLQALPAQIERAVALALANHVAAAAPPPPPAPARSGRFVAASQWPRAEAWDGRAVV